MYVSEPVMFVCAGPSGEAAADNPLRLVGRMILQQSYICALIAMMVKQIFSFFSIDVKLCNDSLPEQ